MVTYGIEMLKEFLHSVIKLIGRNSDGKEVISVSRVNLSHDRVRITIEGPSKLINLLLNSSDKDYWKGI